MLRIEGSGKTTLALVLERTYQLARVNIIIVIIIGVIMSDLQDDT